MTTESQQQPGTEQRTAAVGKKRIAVASLLFLLALLVASYAISGAITFSKVNSLREDANTFAEHLIRGNSTSIQYAAQDVSADIHAINSQLSGPQWALASFLPGIGSDITNVRSIANTADQLCSTILEPMVNEIEEQNTGPLLWGGKRINTKTLQIAIESLVNARESLHEHAEITAALPTCSISKLNKASNTIARSLKALDVAVEEGSSLASNMDYLLGADGSPRQYLLIALNAAELRSIGGLPGSYGCLTVNNGAISVGKFMSLANTQRLVPKEEENTDTTTIAPGLTEEEQILFGRRVVNVPAETATNPQFSRFAESFSYLYTLRDHGEVDGVIAMDLSFFESILAITGSITTSAGIEVDSSNASQLLLHDSYAYMNNNEQDAFFSEVANTCFNKFFSSLNGAKVGLLLKSVWETRYTRQLQVWFPDIEIEDTFTNLGFGGEITGSESEPALGVFVNDDTWSKVSWYLDIDTSISEATLNEDGSASYDVTTTISNHLSLSEAESQPEYVTGFNWRKRSKADMLEWVYLYAPLGGSISNLETDAYFTPVEKTRPGFNGIEEIAGMNKATHMGHEVWFGQIQVDGEKSATFTYTVTTSPRQEHTLWLQQTPTATTW